MTEPTKFGRNTPGFTLIELLVVVAIVSIIAAIALPNLLRLSHDKEPASASRQEEDQKSSRAARRVKEDRPALPTIRPVLDAASVKIDVRPKHKLRGMDVHSSFDATMDGVYTFRNSTSSDNLVKLAFNFPRGAADARDVSLQLSRPGGRWLEPEGVNYSGKGIRWIGALEPGKSLSAKVKYTVQGRERLSFHLPAQGLARDVDVQVTLPKASEDLIPRESLQPTRIDEGLFAWQYGNVVADRPLMIDMPKATTPMGRVILLCKLVGLAVLLFGAGFWYMSEDYKPGQLDDFQWGHFFLLAINYSLFFVIFAVLSFHNENAPLLHMAISAAISLPLLMLHITRFSDRRFALVFILPLAIFTLGLVINGVYGGPIRDYVFIGAIAIIIAYVTITYKGWLKGLEAHRQEKQRLIHRKGRQKATNEALAKFEAECRELPALQLEAREALAPDDGHRFEKQRKGIQTRLDELEALHAEGSALRQTVDSLDKEKEKNAYDSGHEALELRATHLTEKLSGRRQALKSSLDHLLKLRKETGKARRQREGQAYAALQEYSSCCNDAHVAEAEGEEALATDQDEARENTREEMKRCQERLAELSGRQSELEQALSELQSLDDETHERKAALLIATTKRSTRAVKAELQRIAAVTRALSAVEGSTDDRASSSDSPRHCLACGAASPPSKFCPACGTMKTLRYTCGNCGSHYDHPVHLMVRKRLASTLHCLACGSSLGERTESPGESA